MPRANAGERVFDPFFTLKHFAHRSLTCYHLEANERLEKQSTKDEKACETERRKPGNVSVIVDKAFCELLSALFCLWGPTTPHPSSAHLTQLEMYACIKCLLYIVVVVTYKNGRNTGCPQGA